MAWKILGDLRVVPGKGGNEGGGGRFKDIQEKKYTIVYTIVYFRYIEPEKLVFLIFLNPNIGMVFSFGK